MARVTQDIVIHAKELAKGALAQGTRQLRGMGDERRNTEHQFTRLERCIRSPFGNNDLQKKAGSRQTVLKNGLILWLNPGGKMPTLCRTPSLDFQKLAQWSELYSSLMFEGIKKGALQRGGVLSEAGADTGEKLQRYGSSQTGGKRSF